MLKIAICDDDTTMCLQIEKFILEYAKSDFTDIKIEVFNAGEHLIKFITEEHDFDLIFLDIELGTTTGVEIGHKIRNELDDHISKIVFISSKTGYESKLFEVQPLNFLRKPVDKADITKCIELVKKILSASEPMFDYQVGREIIKVRVKDILYFEVNNKKIKIVTIDSADGYFYGNLDSIKAKLPKIFVSPHHSFLVNYNFIDKFTKKDIFMTNKAVIPVSRKGITHIQDMHIKMIKEISDATL